MPKIKFTEDAVYKQVSGDVHFKAGEVHEMPADQCERWKVRKKAVDYVEKGSHAPAAPKSVIVDHKTAPIASAPPVGPVAIPDKFESLGWPQLRDLAEKISGSKPASKPEAVALIQEELDKRAAH